MLIDALLVIAAGLLVVLGIVARVFATEYRRDRVPALLYHRFVDEAAVRAAGPGVDLSYAVTATTFAAQMAHLREAGYSTIHVDRLLEWQEGRADLPPKPILITCDDGFASVYRFAYPVWRVHDMRATVFVTVDRTSGNFAKHAALDAPLTEEQIIEMSRNGIAIESHSMTHPFLADLPDDDVRWELRESMRRIEAMTGRPVRFLAAPSGSCDRRVLRLAREAGYSAVFGMRQGTNNRRTSPYGLRRLTVGWETGLDGFLRLLTPGAAVARRMLGTCLAMLRRILGSQRLDSAIDRATRLGVRRLLAPRRLVVILWAVVVVPATLAALILLRALLGR